MLTGNDNMYLKELDEWQPVLVGSLIFLIGGKGGGYNSNLYLALDSFSMMDSFFSVGVLGLSWTFLKLLFILLHTKMFIILGNLSKTF